VNVEPPARSQRRRPRRSRRLAPALIALAFFGCAKLETLPEDVCGNLTHEPEAGEDCDGQDGCGAPDAGEKACRFLCEPPHGECPEKDKGYSCGLDGVCRRPSGKVEPMGEIVNSFTRDLLTTDLNADGCHEIVHTTLRGVSITALASDKGCPASDQELPAGQPPPAEQAIPPSPMLADLSNDGLPELLLSARGLYGDGLFVHLAESTPTVTPLLYPTLRLKDKTIRPLGVTQPQVDALYVFIQSEDAPTTTVAAVEDPQLIATPQMGELPGLLADIAFLAAADLGVPDAVMANPPEPCDEVLLAFEGRPTIGVYRTCEIALDAMGQPELDPTGQPVVEPVFAEVAEIELAGGAKIRDFNAALAVVDLDGDGSLDILVNTDAPELHVAYGLGNGTFHSQPPAPGVLPDNRTSVVPLPSTPEAALVVDPSHRFVAGAFDGTTPTIEVRALPCPSDEETLTGSPGCENRSPVCESVVDDIDADGNLDVVFTLGADPSIIIARGGKGDQPHLTLLPTECPPHGLVSGDFDGDGIHDVAFLDPITVDNPAAESEPGKPQSQISRSSVSVAYGRAFAVPEPPVASGSIELGAGLGAGKFAKAAPGLQLFAARNVPTQSAPQGGEGGAGMEPMPDEMAPEQPGAGVALVTNRGERTGAAPLYLPAKPTPGGKENLALVELVASTTGQLSAASDKDSRSGVAVISRDLTTSLSPNGEPGTERLWRLSPHGGGGSSLDPPPGSAISAPPCDACVLAAVSTDADDIQEVLLLAGKEAFVYATTEDGFELRATFATTRTFRSLAEDDSTPRKYAPRPVVADLDGDGHEEVLLRATDGMLVVLWGRADGLFDEIPLDLPACEGNELCVATLLHADADAAPELFVLGPEGASLHDIDLTARTLRSIPIQAGSTQLPPDSDFTAVRSGDFDGDGVDDLVIMRTSRFTTVLRGVPENE
jgi:hypothetical protein